MSTVAGPNPEYVKKLFGSISNTYDQANDWITLGLSHRWRKKLVGWSDAEAHHHILDCATGTGDLAFEFKKNLGSKGVVFGADFCEEMLIIARQKAEKNSIPVEFFYADAQRLPFVDQQFNITSIAYGIRNVSQRDIALREMARVTKSGGRLMILETGSTKTIWQKMLNLYFKYLVPRLGGWISGQKNAYQYLSNSSQGFPGGKDFVAYLKALNLFSNVECKSILGGASYIYKATVK